MYLQEINFYGQLGTIDINASENIQTKILLGRYNFDSSSNYKNYIKKSKIGENSISEIEWYKYQNLEVDSKINQPILQPSVKHKLFSINQILILKFLKCHEIKNDEGYTLKGGLVLEYLSIKLTMTLPI